MAETRTQPAAALEAAQERVLEIVRELAAEIRGYRALQAVRAEASLERDIGFGSLERVELIVRLEAAFGRALDDHFIQIDTPGDLARAILDTAEGEPAAYSPAPAQSVAEATFIDLGSTTISEVLWRRAQADPDRPHVFMREDDGHEETITYEMLSVDARAVAGGLRDRGVVKGDTVALMLPTSRGFLAAFQGILMAGAIPVPIYPPMRFDRLEEYAQRQSAILADAGAVLMVTIQKALPIAGLLRPLVPSMRHVTTVDELRATGAPWRTPKSDPSDPALIQYTSGSTGSPKGVLLTHANLVANIKAIGTAVELRPDDVTVSWLPLYHDMGLIGSWLFSLVHGIPIDVQSPIAFLTRPERWLWALHRRRGTLSPAPNFAYELCVRKVPDSALEGLDLSTWRSALNGAEPVNPDTIERFARRFVPCGFRREACLPVYGLAETSVALCFPPVNRQPLIDRVDRGDYERDGRAEPAAANDHRPLRFVSVGKALPDHEVRIVDEAGTDLPERHVGRLIFRGPSVMPGYYKKPEATAAITLPGGWFDSGDLAYLADGEIYIAGRVKDLIIKAGRNLVPQEIEEVAACVDGVRRGCVVAFGVAHQETGTESLVIVAETRATEAAEWERIAAAVISHVAGTIGVPPDVVTMVPPGSVPKTSSGKIRRTATKDLYLRGALGRPPRTPLATRLRLAAGVAWGELRPWLALLPRGVYTAYLATVLPPVALLSWALASILPGRRSVRILERVTSRLAMRLAGCRLSVEGRENLSMVGPVLLAVNHTSYADVTSLLALVPRPFVFVAKREVLRWPMVATFVRRAGHLTVERREVQQSVADAGQVAPALRDGEAVLVFPEATFTGAAGLRPFRLGVFKTSVDTGIPIVPMALRGVRHVLPEGRWIPRPGRVHLWIGRPVAPNGTDFAAMLALRDQVSAEIAAHCGEPVLDLVVGGPKKS
ncbi:MAG: AMP-binding protein [Acidobacteriota bacterium]